MLERSFLWFILCLTLVWRGVAIADDRAANLYERADPATSNGEIDRIVFAELSALGIQPVTCSDAVFVRRAYLDVIGTLPTADEALQFIEDPDVKNKRAALIDRLLDRPEFADYWSMKWGDVLRIKAEFPINLWPNAAQAYHRWVRASIVENKRYDQFAREMLTSSGSNFRVGPVNFYRAMQNKTPEGIASSVALTFMGTRTESWPEERLTGMAVFFSQVGYKPTAEWKEEVVFWDPLDASTLPDSAAPGQAAVVTSLPSSQGTDDARESIAKPAKTYKRSAAVFPDGTKASLRPDRDPREVFADWLITAENPWFTRSIANRVWAWLMGRGIVHEPDDIREDNPPNNPELMAFLEQALIASDYDLKQLYRLILNSATYQMSSLPLADQSEAPWARYPLRRLDAEVLIDAVNQITGTVDLYTSPIPEPFTYIPKDQPAIALADGSITSPFLALFGRSARATGMENERNNRPVASQWLHMLNSGHLQTKLERGPALKAVLVSSRNPTVIAERLYLTILSRRPTDAELKAVASYVGSTPLKRNEAAIDLAWALINSPEFLYRH
ncbi:DUF1549 and DUF1553 domain-containing protein [Stieleria sp. ICT_E10.1]|uniref:DUF1549 and DUF1553 domain-containing protein n=1 Tax=Stieleria sedimenti TaxID=2976331 RepID=UPI00217F30F5|nr:DUF1549 and DUF1553 domain-containing protein [Stieleria sedimenti]MCS7468654.1 DUF1549 and DUF1553 domain-containing protein [Stieleria sedimenti]